MKNFYKFDRKIVFTITGIYAALCIFVFATSPIPFTFDLGTILIIGIGVFLFFDLYFGTYLTLEDQVFTRVDYFFVKKTIPIEKISSVQYRSTFVIGKTNRSLYFFEEERGGPRIEMSNTWFSEKTLSKTLQDLRKSRPALVLDSDAEMLMQKYQP